MIGPEFKSRLPSARAHALNQCTKRRNVKECKGSTNIYYTAASLAHDSRQTGTTKTVKLDIVPALKGITVC